MICFVIAPLLETGSAARKGFIKLKYILFTLNSKVAENQHQVFRSESSESWSKHDISYVCGKQYRVFRWNKIPNGSRDKRVQNLARD